MHARKEIDEIQKKINKTGREYRNGKVKKYQIKVMREDLKK